MLKLQQITKSFNGKKVLDGINVDVADGEILCIVGQSGAGKTTLLRCIAGLEKIDSGKFLIDNQPFDPYTNPANEAVIGVVFQEFNLFPHLTVKQNITLAPTLVLKQSQKQANQKAEELLAHLKLADKAALYPYQLSGGQKQRVAIARALAMAPKILCYDEPTSALDPGLRDAVKAIILQLKQTQMTQIIVTHDIAFAKEIADKILTVKPLNAATEEG